MQLTHRMAHGQYRDAYTHIHAHMESSFFFCRCGVRSILGTLAQAASLFSLMTILFTSRCPLTSACFSKSTAANAFASVMMPIVFLCNLIVRGSLVCSLFIHALATVLPSLLGQLAWKPAAATLGLHAPGLWRGVASSRDIGTRPGEAPARSLCLLWLNTEGAAATAPRLKGCPTLSFLDCTCRRRETF